MYVMQFMYVCMYVSKYVTRLPASCCLASSSWALMPLRCWRHSSRNPVGEQCCRQSVVLHAGLPWGPAGCQQTHAQHHRGAGSGCFGVVHSVREPLCEFGHSTSDWRVRTGQRNVLLQQTTSAETYPRSVVQRYGHPIENRPGEVWQRDCRRTASTRAS